MLSAGNLLLLEGAIGYAVDNVRAVTADRLARPTPCAGWNLFELLAHFHDVLDIFHDSLLTGYLDVDDVPVSTPGGDVAAAFCAKAARLLALLSEPEPALGPVAIDDRELRPDLMAKAMCLEIAVHGWDVARTVGPGRPIPSMLATEVLRIAVEIVPDDIRPELFRPALEVPATASASDRLVAFLGRSPAG